MRGRLARGAWVGLLGLALAPALLARAQPPSEAGTVDAGRPAVEAVARDAGRTEALDAGRADAGRAETPDAGRPRRPDAGSATPAVAEPVDAGSPDVGAEAAVDAAASTPDAGAPDAGVVGALETEPDEGLVEAATSAAVELTREPTTAEVVRTLLGLLALLTLAWLGGLPAVRRLEERLGITQVVTSGMPFVGLGVLMHAPGVDVLSDDVLTSITPLLQFGLGWIGFHTGFQFEARAMDEVSRGTGSVVVVLTSFPFLLISLLATVVLLVTGLGVIPEGLGDHAAWLTIARDACLLGLAGALSAPIAGSLVKGANGRTPQLAATIAVLDDVFGVLALALLAAWLRPEHAEGWQLPSVGWLFITLGMAATLGLVVHFALLTAESTGERTALLLGSVAFTAGLAGYASLSPLVVCFLAGLVLRNVPGGDKAVFEAAFTRLERPVYLLFLTIVGALWRIDDWRGWLLFALFVLARVGGRFIGARAARRLPPSNRPASLDATQDRDLVFAPMGQLAIAFVVAAQTLYESPAIRAIVTAVIGGSVVSEALARLATRPSSGAEQPEAPSDDDAEPGTPPSGDAEDEAPSVEAAEPAASTAEAEGGPTTLPDEEPDGGAS